jgi:hypothetical protein
MDARVKREHDDPVQGSADVIVGGRDHLEGLLSNHNWGAALR